MDPIIAFIYIYTYIHYGNPKPDHGIRMIIRNRHLSQKERDSQNCFITFLHWIFITVHPSPYSLRTLHGTYNIYTTIPYHHHNNNINNKMKLIVALLVALSCSWTLSSSSSLVQAKKVVLGQSLSPAAARKLQGRRRAARRNVAVTPKAPEKRRLMKTMTSRQLPYYGTFWE